MESIQKAIISAGNELGWRMLPTGPGVITGTFEFKTKHAAVITITYDTKTYTIKYQDSTDLHYDGTNIHRVYNGWVTSLDRAIRTQLASI